jgi:serine/threonine protein phosphatase PrpC
LRVQPLRLPVAPGKSGFVLHVGCATRGAPGKPNEDFYGIASPAGAAQGTTVAIADGISPNGSGRVAAETTVRSLLQDYYATPAGWSTSLALMRLLQAANDWQFAANRQRPALGGAVAALSALVFRDGRYYLAHVGDTRVYRRRAAVLERLTVDHTWPRPDMRHVLKRAVGLDTHLVVDFADGELRHGDAFLLASDGVWDVLGDAQIAKVLISAEDPQRAASTLVEAALAQQAAYMGRNDATAVVAVLEGGQ